MQPGAIQRQNRLVIFQQDSALFGNAARGFEAPFDIHHVFLYWIIDNAAGKFRAQNAMHVIVQFGGGNFACLHGLLEFLSKENIFRLFVIQSGDGRFFGAMRPTPVRKHKAFEIPVLLEHVRQQVLIFAGVVAVDGVVGTHHSGRIGNFDSDLKSQQVALAHGALADDHVHRIAPAFLIV